MNITSKDSDQEMTITLACIVNSHTNNNFAIIPNKSQKEPGVIMKIFSSFNSMKDGLVDAQFDASTNID
ncbi:MAG: hypothetical protein MHMPM18_001137 [Marteilia pararefringens]